MNGQMRTNSSLHVLLVDDDSFMLELIGDMLQDCGVTRITTALDGKRGFSAFESAKPVPDVVFCDINMPGKDGFQFMEMLAEKRYHGGVVLVSGMESRVMNSAELMGKFHHLNILGALQKPVDKQALLAILSKVCTGAS